MICYGRFSKVLNDEFIEFPAQFVNTNYTLTVSRYNNTNKVNVSNAAIWVDSRLPTKFSISGNDSIYNPYGIWGDYIAIGTWK